MEFPSFLQDLLRVVEAARELLVQERRDKLQLEMRLREEICNEMWERMQRKEQWCRYSLCWSLCSGWAAAPRTARPWHVDVCSLCSQYVDTQERMLEELYEDKLNNLKESLTDYYQEEIQVCSGQWNDIRKVAVGWERTQDIWVHESDLCKLRGKILLFVVFLVMILESVICNFCFLSSALCNSPGFLIFSR